VRIKELRAELMPDNRRVRVYLEVTPFQKRPNGEVRISNATGDELASVSIIETMITKMEFTLHLRGAELIGPYTLSAFIAYLQEAEQSRRTGTSERSNRRPAEPGQKTSYLAPFLYEYRWQVLLAGHHAGNHRLTIDAASDHPPGDEGLAQRRMDICSTPPRSCWRSVRALLRSHTCSAT
jgi:hypothetical protein